MRPKLMQQLGHDFVLHAPGPREAHGAAMSSHADLGGPAQTGLLGTALIQPHVVQYMPQRNKLLRSARALACLHPQPIDPVGHMRIEIRMRTHGVKYLRALFHQSRQYFIDVRDRKRIVRTVALDRAVGTCSGTIPGLAHGVVFAHEQQILRVGTPGYQHRHGIRLRKSAQVVKMAVLTVGILDVAVAMAHGGRREYGNRVLADHAHELAPPPREFLAIHHPLNAAAAAPDRPVGAAAAVLRTPPGPRPG